MSAEERVVGGEPTAEEPVIDDVPMGEEPAGETVGIDEGAAAEAKHDGVVTGKENKCTKWMSNRYVLWSLRFAEFAFAVIVLGLTAATVDFDYYTSSKNNFGVAVAVMSLVYFIVGFLYLKFMPASTIIVGVMFGAELIMMLFWLIAFIVLADANGDRNCGLSSYSIGSFTFDLSDTNRGCKTGKAAIAMAAINWVLFLITFVIFIYNVLKPVIHRYGSSGWYKGNVFNFDAYTFLRGDVQSSAADQMSHGTDFEHKEDYETNHSNVSSAIQPPQEAHVPETV